MLGGRLSLRRLRNLMAQRDVIYPASFRELLINLVSIRTKKREAVAYGPLQDGLHYYGGWFFFIGEMVGVGDELSSSESPYFKFHFTRYEPCPAAFPCRTAISIEFEPTSWVLDESWIQTGVSFLRLPRGQRSSIAMPT